MKEVRRMVDVTMRECELTSTEGTDSAGVGM